jgi:2-methylisocitrate lyase-like PEP mutase family enzyme
MLSRTSSGGGRPGDALRAIVEERRTVMLPGVWDPLSATLAVEAGFEALFQSGFATAGALLGLPDIGYLTQSEMAEVARRVCGRVTGTPVVVDVDTGYGNALNVARTIDLMETAGAAGIILEDQAWPKKCGHMSGKKVIEADDWLVKIRAAVDRRDQLFVIARTDARSVLGVDEAIERARRAADLGADAVLVEAAASVEEFEMIADAVRGCALVANMVESGRTPLLSTSELGGMGFSFVISSVAGLFAATQALLRFWQDLAKDGTSAPHLERMVGFEQFAELIGTPDHTELELRYADTPDR